MNRLEWFKWKTTFTHHFEKVNDCYLGYVEELPGENTQGKTLDEARDNLCEAIALILLPNREITEKGLQNKEFIREEIKVEI